MSLGVKGTTGNTMTLKDSFLGSLLDFLWSVQTKLLSRKEQNNNQTHTKAGFQGIQTGCSGNSGWGTECSSTQ